MDNKIARTDCSSLRIRSNYPENSVEIFLCNNKDIPIFCFALSLQYCSILSNFLISNSEESGYEDEIWFDIDRQLVKAGLLKGARLYFKAFHPEDSDLITFGLSVQFSYKTKIIEAFCFEKHDISYDEIYEIVKLVTPEYIKSVKNKELPLKRFEDSLAIKGDGHLYKLWIRNIE